MISLRFFMGNTKHSRGRIQHYEQQSWGIKFVTVISRGETIAKFILEMENCFWWELWSTQEEN